ncbi:helix-turn-helix domain-containing protein [Nitrosomonas sp.]|uniref:helix-turn-helix domain-containing protein n=1 Tax=Nitrosomonas sp. TaxID=42353 RepID=UPI0025EA6A1C|nr:helix-turn-helix domain-containing protein [Nitrosomonas sp.]
MKTILIPLDAQASPHPQIFPPLEQVTRTILTTEEAAHYLNRRPQTLRAWACLENGALRPVRINGRLAWPVSEIKKILGVEV